MRAENPLRQRTKWFKAMNKDGYNFFYGRKLDNSFLEKKRQGAIQALESNIYPIQFFAFKSVERGGVNLYTSLRRENKIITFSQKKHTVTNKKKERLDIFYDLVKIDNPLNGVIINTISHKAGQLWFNLWKGNIKGPDLKKPRGLLTTLIEKIPISRIQRNRTEIIPISPILKKGQKPRIFTVKNSIWDGKTVRFYTRYCGISVLDLQSIYSKKNDNNYYQQRQKILIDTMKEKIEGVRKMLIAMYEIPNPYHHPANFCVEFINKEYFDQELQNGETVNTIKYRSDKWSFDPEEYLDNPKEWEFVVRIVDPEDLVSINTRKSGKKSYTGW